MKIKYIFFALGTTLMLSNRTTAQGLSNEQILNAWDNITRMVVESAEAMPPEYYQFSPFEGARNFADQMNHTAMANFTFFGVSLGLEKKTDPVQGQVKEEVVQDLKRSFAYVRLGIEGLDTQSLEASFQRRNGSISTRMAQLIRAIEHQQREHGKTIMYLRLKGIAPARSGGF